MARPTDTPVLERIAAGDPAAVREALDLYGDLVWSLARRFTRTEADAEEAVQDIFVLLWRKSAQFDPSKGREATFVSVLARRMLIDRWRRTSRDPAPVSSRAGAETSAGATDGDFLERDEATAAALEAFAELDEEVQTVLRLSVEHGCSHGAISDITGMPLGSVKTRVRTGLRRIREALRPLHASGEMTGARS